MQKPCERAGDDNNKTVTREGSLSPTPFYGEQGWRSGESARLPPMWSGFDSGPVSYVG